MELHLASDLAIRLMVRYSLIEKGWGFNYDSAVRRFGLCSYRKNTIFLSKPLTLLNDEAQVRDTILHEIAHALVGSGHHHDKVWKAKCVEIGAKPLRCCAVGKITPDKYVAVCVCGKVFSRINKPKRGRLVYCMCQDKKPFRKYLKYKKI